MDTRENTSSWEEEYSALQPNQEALQPARGYTYDGARLLRTKLLRTAVA